MTTYQRYMDRVGAGDFEADEAQIAVARQLARLEERLATYRLARKSSALGWLFGQREADAEPIRGVYIWGSVGRGKTMLMDLFFQGSPIQRKRRAHFHEFMADVHSRIHTYRQRFKNGEVKNPDPIIPVADALADEAWLLCFDEFAVTDIADAMILGRLFTQFFKRGVVVVATSNVEPSDLYRGGLNRSLFTPFIGLLTQNLDVVKLDARTDFRLEKLGNHPVWITPVDEEAYAAMDATWQNLTHRIDGQRQVLNVRGHELIVPMQADGVARFTFAQLCEAPLGASDFLALARSFHTIMIDGIPKLRDEERNPAKRFITLIDTLYERNVKLIASAQADPEQLYEADGGTVAFEFDRAVSRLIEMRSTEYLARPHGRGHSDASDDMTGIVDT